MTSPFVTIEELGKFFSVSVSTIRGWTRSGHIPESTYIKIGNTYRFNRDEVAKALMSMSKDAAEETVRESTVVEVEGVEGSILTMGEPQPDENQLEFDFDADEDV